MAKKKREGPLERNVHEIARKGVVHAEIENAGQQIEKLGKGVVKKITKPLVTERRKQLTFGQLTADWLAKWAGSWTFIIFFFLVLVGWMSLNAYFWAKYKLFSEPFDPYPFILLNLVLSCLAAIQAPVILMSQNRAAERDRLRAEYDYQVNRRAEREIQGLRKQLNRIEDKLNLKLKIKPKR